MRDKKTSEPWTFDIPNHGIEDDTVGYMLSHWCMTLAGCDEWLEDDVVDELIEDYNLTLVDIERLSEKILTTIDHIGLAKRLRRRTGFLQSAYCTVDKNLVCLLLIWE